MTLLDDIKKYIKKKINALYDYIKDINDAIVKDLTNRLNGVKQYLENIISNISKEIFEKFKEVSSSLKNITDLITAPLDFSGLIKPFKELIGFAIGGVKDEFIKLLNVGASDAIYDQIDDYGEARRTDHITSFEGFMKFSNDIWSISAGIKPFNIILGKENWLDETKKGVYYDIMRGICLSYIFFTWGSNALNSFFSMMSDQKYKEHYAYSKLSIQEYQKLEFRGKLENGELNDMALFLGYDERAMELLNKITKFYPSVRDSIDFAVREAFEPDDKLFIHGGNAIPQPFAEIATTLGIDEIWIKRFWHSHWRLLGSGQVLEAFHRGFINKDELLDYLRRLDYVEKDRQVIMDMSYNLLTRVDIRRIFEQGLISSMDLYNYYGKLGFTEQDQALMTGLAKQLRFIDTNDLRKIYIERFENGLISESEIKTLLHGTGLDSDEINSYLELSDTQKELDFLIELKKRIETKFYDGDIDFDELVQQLRQLGVSNRELKRIEKNAVLFDFRKKKLPTLAELKRYYKKQIIDLNKFVYYALRLGLETEHIFWILKDIS